MSSDCRAPRRPRPIPRLTRNPRRPRQWTEIAVRSFAVSPMGCTAKWVSDLSPCPRFCRGIGRAVHGGGFRSFRKRYANLEPRRGLAGSCNSRNFRKRCANRRWLGVAGVGRSIARARIVATGNSFAPHRDPEIDLKRGRVQCHRAMALREIIQASEHDGDPVQVGLGSHTPQHCSGTSRIRRARWLHVGHAR